METADVSKAVPGAIIDARHSLDTLMDRLGLHARFHAVREGMGAYVRGLLGRVERRNCWQLAEEVGRETPYALQHLLGRAIWDEDGVRDEVALFVGETLGREHGTMALDESGIVKKGKKSAGVARMYCGTTGCVENCQIGVFLSYHAADGHSLIDRELYLPEEWTKDAPRCREAGVPDDREFETKPDLARQMLKRAFALGYRPDWVTGDEVYGQSPELRRDMESRGQPYVLTVASNTSVNPGGESTRRVDAVIAGLRADAFQAINIGNGAKGPRIYDWTRVDLGPAEGRLHRWLMARRNRTTAELAYYFVGGFAGTRLEEMARAAGDRWPIEECFETDKGKIGLDEYEVRSYHGWYRHVTLVMAAQAYLVNLRVKINEQEMPADPKARSSQSLNAYRRRQRLACASAFRKSANSRLH
jgi:SRSO17 transposase